MRRLVTLFSVATLSVLGGVIGTSAVASGSTDSTVPPDTAAAVHPVVGTWMLTDVDPDPEDVGFTGAFLSDGIYVEVDSGDVSLGVWEATGPDTAAMTFTSTDEEGSLTVRVSITVDGDNLSADYTLEADAEGAPSGEYGPGHVTGTRVAVEPMGTPVGSIDELFGAFEEGSEGTEVVESSEDVESSAVAEATEVAAPPTTSA